ncbi:MAG TPA: TonB-dependent receptor [Steroidobacteraceae bacterium]|nr:TonB-dependent receptor [Steroidobacteraceae bacterium]
MSEYYNNRIFPGGHIVAVNNRIRSATALAALSVSATALAQTPPADSQGDELDTVIVTGVRQSLTQGLENKRESTQVIESIVAEDIGKLPDNNVIEALQRVTGVQITNRGGGEADGIVIRGLPDATTTWNGRNVFTGTGRALALQDIPANLISRVDVFKTRAAEQLETGLAGQIDVRTRRPFDVGDFEMSVNARLTDQVERDDAIDPNVSFLVSNTWDGNDGRFGALLNVTYSKVRYRDQSITAGALVPFVTADGPLPPGFTPLQRVFNGDPPIWQAGTDRGLPYEEGSLMDFDPGPGVANFPYLLSRDALFASDFKGNRKRPAANLALQWAPNDSQEYTFEAFYQGYREEMFNNLQFTFVDWWGNLGPDPASTITLYPGTNLIKTRVVGAPYNFNSGDSTHQETDTFVYALNGKWQLSDKFTLEADLSFQGSQFDTTFVAIRTDRVPPQISLDLNHGDGLPSWHYTDPTNGANTDAAMLDAAGWNMAQLYQNKGRDIGGAQTLTVDGDYEFGGNVFKKLSFGVRYDDRNALHRQPRPGDTAERVLPSGMTLAAAAEALGSDDFLYTNDDFFTDSSSPHSWVLANGWYIGNHPDDIRALYGAPTGGPVLRRAFQVDERTASAYVQTDMDFGDRFHAQVGVRYVRVDTPIEFIDLVPDDLPVYTAKQSVDDLMPSVTLRWDITNDFRLRANYGETLRRPAFGDLNPNFNLTGDLTGVGYGTGAGGNPELTAAKGKNYDLTAEWYFARDSAIYGTAFRREIDGLVVPLVRELSIPGSGLNTDRFKVTQPVNASDGVLKGFELGFLYFPELPGAFNGLGLQGSFTKLDSSQNIPLSDNLGNIVGEENTEFFGVSDFSYNVTLAYDHAGFGGRLSYVWRDDFLNNNEARIFANPIGVWRKPESSLDLQLSYEINEKMGVSFDAVNLTDEMQQSYYAFGDAGSPTLTNFGSTVISRAYMFGFRWKY